MDTSDIEAIAQHIEAAACLIEESGWTRGRLFRDRKGNELSSFHQQGTRFCIVGALIATSSDAIRNSLDCFESSQTSRAKDVLFAFLGELPMGWNDFRAKGKRDVIVRMLDCASALRKGEIKI